MKKADVILLAIILVIGILGISIYFIAGAGAEFVFVSVDGETVGVYALNTDRELNIPSDNGGENLLKIENGTARMISANCPNGDCIRHKAISQSNESIVCLPHKVVVTVIKDPSEGEMDAIAY